jgi:release factor glutamine methyltransferase
MTPRSTTELLVTAACERIDGAARIADVGTGSGAVAIALAVARPEAHVWATDVDARAVALARANVARFGLGDRVFVRRGDLLAPVPAPVDLIVANLPYLPATAAGRYPDLRDEPFRAVFDAGDGLVAYRRLLAAAPSKLTPTGTLLLQLHGHVIVAKRQELMALREALRRDSEVLSQAA